MKGRLQSLPLPANQRMPGGRTCAPRGEAEIAPRAGLHDALFTVKQELGSLLEALLVSQAIANDLLRAILAEARSNQPGRARPAAPRPSIREDFLRTVSQLLGSESWTCEELLAEADYAAVDAVEHANLRVVLRDMGIDRGNAKKLGSYLGKRKGAAASGFRLAQHGCTREGARRWSIDQSQAADSADPA